MSILSLIPVFVAAGLIVPAALALAKAATTAAANIMASATRKIQ